MGSKRLRIGVIALAAIFVGRGALLVHPQSPFQEQTNEARETPADREQMPSALFHRAAFGFEQDAVNSQDEANWKLGFIYFNRSDSRVFVPKRFGVGNTLNLARPGAWLFVIGLAVVVTIIVTQVKFWGT